MLVPEMDRAALVLYAVLLVTFYVYMDVAHSHAAYLAVLIRLQ